MTNSNLTVHKEKFLTSGIQAQFSLISLFWLQFTHLNCKRTGNYFILTKLDFSLGFWAYSERRKVNGLYESSTGYFVQKASMKVRITRCAVEYWRTSWSEFRLCHHRNYIFRISSHIRWYTYLGHMIWAICMFWTASKVAHRYWKINFVLLWKLLWFIWSQLWCMIRYFVTLVSFHTNHYAISGD